MADELRVVSIADEALDTKAMGPEWSKYMKKRDPAMVREIPGKKLTWFTVRLIPTSLFNSFVQPAPDLFTRYMRAFQVGVTKIENWQDPKTGRVLDAIQPDSEARYATGTIQVWKDEIIDGMPPVYVEEIGSIAYGDSFLGQRSGGNYQPPPTLGHVVAARAHHDVARILAQQAQSNAQRSDSPPDRTKPDDD